MFHRIARAIEGFLGPALANAAETLETCAALLLVAAVAIPLVRALFFLRAWRHGWERALVVRCRRCGRLVADPELAVCPSGHAVRFPFGAEKREAWRRRLAGWRRAALFYPTGLALLAAAAPVAGYATLRVGRLQTSLASIAAALAFLFLIGFLYAASDALSPLSRGWTNRLFHAGLALVLLLPVLLLGSLAQALEPPERKVLGHFWSTPTALYFSSGRRARRVGPAATQLEALIVEVRLPALGIVWEGLKGFRTGEKEIPWNGRGGTVARWLDRWADPGSREVLLIRSARSMDLPPNVKFQIVKEKDRLRFVPEGGFPPADRLRFFR